MDLGNFLAEVGSVLPSDGRLLSGPHTGAGACTQAELQLLMLLVLPSYFDSPQAVLTFPAPAASYLAGLQHFGSAEATWKPTERLLVAASAAVDQYFSFKGRQAIELPALCSS